MKSRQYAWDIPTDEKKSLVLQVNDKERELDLLEIGNMLPMKYKVYSSDIQ